MTSSSSYAIRAAVGTVLLSGCMRAPLVSTAPAPRPDCSFRSATTCWTMAGRFPTPAAEARDSVPDELLKEPAATLAAGR